MTGGAARGQFAVENPACVLPRDGSAFPNCAEVRDISVLRRSRHWSPRLQSATVTSGQKVRIEQCEAPPPPFIEPSVPAMSRQTNCPTSQWKIAVGPYGAAPR